MSLFEEEDMVAWSSVFDDSENEKKASKEEFNREEPAIREALLAIQKELAGTKLSVVIVVSGVEGAGKSETINLLHEWMDARGLMVHAPWEASEEELERPPMWRFWRILPPLGRIGVLFGSWYTAPIIDRVFGRIDEDGLDRALARIVDFERMLDQENTLLLKFWFHLSKKQQKKRMKELASDSATAWRLAKLDKKFFKKYDDFREVSGRAVSRTSTDSAPWRIVGGADPRRRALTVTRTILEELRGRIEVMKAAKRPRAPGDKPAPLKNNAIRKLDYSLSLDKDKYEKQIEKHSGRLAVLSRELRERGRSAVAVFEGADAAGKGGAIRRMIAAMDSRMYQVVSVAAPTEEERAHPYLWRFWRHLPRKGRMTVFDRSWYGRVLVERIEGFCSRDEWSRAFGEINDFEEQLAESGVIVVKFWITITQEEQLERFKNRQTTPFKQYKITEEDWRNREKWDAYEAAACEMFKKTSTRSAPWVLVEGNDKNWARVKVLNSMADRLEEALEGKG